MKTRVFVLVLSFSACLAGGRAVAAVPASPASAPTLDWSLIMSAAKAQQRDHERHHAWDPLNLPIPPASVLAPARAAIARQSRTHEKALAPSLRPAIKKTREQQVAVMDRARHEVFAQLGIPERGTGHLYILVSESMPATLLAGYAQDAVWTGAVLVFRGVDPDHDIPWFMTHVMKPLTRKGASPTLTLDPRLFAAFEAKVVPTLVYSTADPRFMCDHSVLKHAVRDHGKKPPVPYHGCAPADSGSYWELAGAVSTLYALRQFADDGAPGAGRLIKALRADPLTGDGRKPLALSSADYGKAVGPSSLGDLLHLMTAPMPQLEGMPPALPPLVKR